MAAARAADFILIPCRPALLDIRAIKNSIDIANLAGTNAAIVLNCIQARGSLANEAEQAIKSYGTLVAPVRITNRAAFVHSITTSEGVKEFEPSGKAA